MVGTNTLAYFSSQWRSKYFYKIWRGCKNQSFVQKKILDKKNSD